MPTISIIVPVYKVEAYLDDCIKSILAQTFTDFELILVDDGSPDNCPHICDEWAKKDKRIIVIHKKNEGVAVARNVALDIASGEYVAFCDSDDMWLPTLLESAISEATLHNCDVVVYNYSTQQNGIEIRHSSFMEGIFEFHNNQERVDYLCTLFTQYKHGREMWTRLFRNSIIKEHNLRCCTTCNNFAEDMTFVMCYMLYANKLSCIPGYPYIYRFHDLSMMRRSQNIIKLNDVNEAAFFFYQEYQKAIKEKELLKLAPFLHLTIISDQIHKIKPLSQLPEYVSKLTNKLWFNKSAKKIKKGFKAIKRYYGKDYAIRVKMFSSYLTNLNWKLYSIKTGIYFKYVHKHIKGE